MSLKSLGQIGCFFISLMFVSSVYGATLYHTYTLNQSTPPPTTITTLCFDPKEITVPVGEVFTIDIKLTSLEEELWGFEIGVRFDNALLEYVGVKLPYWRFVSGQTEWLFWVAGSTPQTGDQILLRLTFRSKGVGESTLDFYSHKLATLKDLSSPHVHNLRQVGWPITHEVSTAVVNIS